MTPKIQIFHPRLSIFPRGAARCQPDWATRAVCSAPLGYWWELRAPQSNRQIQTGSSAGRRALIPRNINSREEWLSDFIINISLRPRPCVPGLETATVTILTPTPWPDSLLHLSGFPESVGLNDHSGPQIQLKVITGATSSQTNKRVRPDKVLLFSLIRMIRSTSDNHPGNWT